MAIVYLGHRKYTLYFNYSDGAVLMTECWMGNAYILQFYIYNDCYLIILIQHVCKGFGAGDKFLGRIKAFASHSILCDAVACLRLWCLLLA